VTLQLEKTVVVEKEARFVVEYALQGYPIKVLLVLLDEQVLVGTMYLRESKRLLAKIIQLKHTNA
jgi:hypothetical protein